MVGWPGNWYFPHFTFLVDLVLAGYVGDGCSSTDSSSLASFFFRANGEPIFGFLNPMRLRSVQGPAEVDCSD